MDITTLAPEATTVSALLATTNISYSIGGKVLFTGVDIQCNPGELVSLVGPSGSGKTTLLGILGLLLKPSSGDVTINGELATGWRGRRKLNFWKKSAAFIYQDYGMIENETVAYNVTLIKRLSLRRRNGHSKRRIDGVLSTVGLSGRGDDKTAILSGGEKQRVGIARAMWKNAAVVFADEPTASLDDANREAVIELFEGIARQGTCIIMATHDDELVARSNRVIDVSSYRPSR